MVSAYSGGKQAQYHDRPDGMRHSKIVDGATTVHLWDGQNIVADTDAAGVVASTYLRGINLIATKGAEGNHKFYLYNAHGDVVQLADDSGAVLWQYDYDAFGVQKAIEGQDASSDTTPFRYCGEYFDRETDTVYLRARYYDPVIGRFMAEDSVTGITCKLPNGQEVTDPLSLNRYTYAHNNPVLFVDADGNAVHIAAGALIGAFIGATINLGSQLITNGWNVDARSVWAAAGAGAVSGAMASATGGLSLLGSVGAGALIGGAQYGTNNLLAGEKASLTGYAGSMAVGGAVSGVGYALQGHPMSASRAAKKIVSAERTSIALTKADAEHRAASYLSEKQLSKGTTFNIANKKGVQQTLLQVKGSLNAKDEVLKKGIYEYILNPNNTVSHQRFIPGGKITGYPNQAVKKVGRYWKVLILAILN